LFLTKSSIKTNKRKSRCPKTAAADCLSNTALGEQNQNVVAGQSQEVAEHTAEDAHQDTNGDQHGVVSSSDNGSGAGTTNAGHGSNAAGVHIEVEDLGFGGFYRCSGQKWTRKRYL